MATAIGQMTQMPRIPGITPTAPKAPGESFDPLIQELETRRAPIAEKISTGEQQELAERQRTAEYEAGAKARQAKGVADIEAQRVKQLEEAPARKEVEALGKQEKDFFFQPGERDGMSLATTASLMMVIGMSLGKGGKFSAMNALSGLNGMMEGHRKRSDELYKQEKQQFESNAKALRDKLSFAIQALERYEKDVIRNADVAKQNLSADLAKEGLDFVKQRGERAPIISQLPELRKSLSALDKQLGDYRAKKANAEEAALRDKERREAQFMMQEHLQQERLMFQREAQLERNQQAAERKQDKFSAEQARSQRTVNALGGVASSLEAIAALPIGTTTEAFPNLMTKDGMINGVRNFIGRKISSTDADMMNTFFKGLGRNLAAIESSGLATGLATLAQQLESGVYINAGQDDPYRVAAKLADIRRVAVENIQPAIDAGFMVPKQAQVAQTLVDRIKKAVPYDTIEVVNAYREARGLKKPTIGEKTESVVTGRSSSVPTFNTVEEANAAGLAPGTSIIVGGRRAVVE